MRVLFFLMLASTTIFGQRTLINLDGINSFEFGGQFVPMSSSQAGIWAAYNGFLRGEIFANKYTSSFSQGTEFGGRITIPIGKQTQTFPVNIFADGEYTRFEGSGFSSDYIYGSGIVSHRIRNGNNFFSPFASAGYIRFSSSGDFKWTFGLDIQLNKFLLSAEHGRIGGSGTTYLRAGFKFGKSRNNDLSDNSSDQEMPGFINDVEEDQNEKDVDQVVESEVISNEDEVENEAFPPLEEIVDNRTEEQKKQDEELAKKIEEMRRQEELKEEQIAKDQKRLEELRAQQKATEEKQLEQQRKEQALLEQQKKLEQLKKEESLNQPAASQTPTALQQATAVIQIETGRFSIQFFASSDPDKSFSNLRGIGTIYTEYFSERNLYRYLIGYYNTREEAERVKSQMRQMGYSDAFVREN